MSKHHLPKIRLIEHWWEESVKTGKAVRNEYSVGAYPQNQAWKRRVSVAVMFTEFDQWLSTHYPMFKGYINYVGFSLLFPRVTSIKKTTMTINGQRVRAYFIKELRECKKELKCKK